MMKEVTLFFLPLVLTASLSADTQRKNRWEEIYRTDSWGRAGSCKITRMKEKSRVAANKLIQ